MLKINFGCFSSNIDGWIGVDHALRHIIVQRIPFMSFFLWKFRILNDTQYDWHKRGLFRTVVYGDARERLKFGTESADYVYSSHLLEHLFRDEAVFFLKECFRILRTGGKIRICIPDWDSLKIQPSFENSGFAKNRKEMKNSHKWSWAKADLGQVLTNIGFRNIMEYDFQKGNFPDVERLEHRKGLILQGQK